MEKINEFKVVYPNQGITCRVARVPGVNENYFDWFVSNLPTPTTVWNPALIAGHIAYSHNLEVKNPFPYDFTSTYENSDKNVYLNEAEPGVFTLFCGAGNTGMIIAKYGPECTEPMCYPLIAKVVPEDLDNFYKANKTIWDITYGSEKKPATLVRFEL